MDKSKKILKNTFIYAIGNFGSKALTFLLLPLYSYYLTKGEFGTYDLFIVTIGLLAPLISLQTSDSVYRWLIEADGDNEKQSKILFNGFLIIIVTATIFLIVYFILINFITFQYSGYFVLLLVNNLFLPFFQKILRGMGENKKYAISGLINTLLILMSNILFLFYFNLKLESLFLATIISGVITIVYINFYINIKKSFSLKYFDKDEIRNMVRYSLPLVPNYISWWLINASDKYFILIFLSIELNGIYAVSTRLASVLMLINSVFLMAWQDYSISNTETEENSVFNSRIFNMFVKLELTIVIFLISISQILVKYLIDSVYFESWKYIPFLFIGASFSAFSAFIGAGYQRNKRTKGILVTSLIGGVFNLTFSLLFIKQIGLYAPSLATLLSFFIVYLLRKFGSNKFFVISVDNVTLILLTALAIIYSYLVTIEILFLNTTLILFSIFLLFYLNKSIAIKLIRYVMEQFSGRNRELQ